MSSSLDDDIIRVAEILAEKRHSVALTGAGLSVPSGIHDFRSPGGIWERFDPAEYATIDAFLRDPEKVWVFLKELDDLVKGAKPNPAHEALAQLEAMGVLDGVITQNVDGLHQAGGSKKVIEFHGGHGRLVCPHCGRKRKPDPDMEIPPYCECGQAMKPDVVFFGEPIPPQALLESTVLARQARSLIVAGTSATVAPASLIPHEAAAGGALIIEVNLVDTPLTAFVTDIFLRGPVEEILPRLAQETRRRGHDA
jgi:NAD-dependent deacetylase